MTPLLLTALLTVAQPGTSPVRAFEKPFCVQADSTDLRAYVGTYTFPEGAPVSQFVIKLEKGELMGEADSYGANKLVKQPKPDTFQSTSQYGSILTFERAVATNEITGFTMQVMGQELKATRKK